MNSAEVLKVGEGFDCVYFLCIYEMKKKEWLSVCIYMCTEGLRRKLVNDQLALYREYSAHM